MYCHVTSRNPALIYPSSRDTGINPAELISSSPVPSPEYHPSSGESSPPAPHHPAPLFLSAAAAPP